MQSFQHISHHAISQEYLDEIYAIKAISWPFDLDSQANWIKKNLKDEDIHVLLWEDGILQAYLNIIPVVVKLDSKDVKMMGIGNVCSRTKNMGYGSLLLAHTNKWIKDENYAGLLFCKQDLLPFYIRHGWKAVDPARIVIDDARVVFVMIYNREIPEKIDITCKLF